MSDTDAQCRTPDDPARTALSIKAVTVLKMIGRGHTYEQILQMHPALTYQDIFDAAAEALRAADVLPRRTLRQIRQRHARAYEKWTDAEESRMLQLIRQGYTIARIAGVLQRQRSAIRGRIARLGWVELLAPIEKARLLRAMPSDSA